MLKLLKVLFLIEKYGIPKRYAKHRDTKDIRIRIIDILAKPRLSNVNSYLSEASQYGEIIDNLIDDIKSNVDDADMCIDMIERMTSFLYLHHSSIPARIVSISSGSPFMSIHDASSSR